MLLSPRDRLEFPPPHSLASGRGAHPTTSLDVVHHSKIVPPMTGSGHSRPRRFWMHIHPCPILPDSDGRPSEFGLSRNANSRHWRAYSITSSASASNVGGTSRPRECAVLRLITNSNLVGCTTGSSAGFSPLRTRPT